MGLFNWTPKSKIQDFSTTIADEIVRKLPPNTRLTREPSAARISKVLEVAFKKSNAFIQENSLGILGKARLGNSFRWALKERGYNDDFIYVATEGLLVLSSQIEKKDQK